MARDRFSPVALHALRSLAPSDPLAPLVARAMQARVPHQRTLNIAPRSEAYLDNLSEADPRDLSNREALLLRNAPVSEEMDPMEREPDADYDDPRGVSPMGMRMKKEYQQDMRAVPSQMEVYGGFGGDPALAEIVRASRGGR